MGHSVAVNLGHAGREDLMARVGAGDSDAIRSLILDYRPRVFNYLYRWMGNREDAMDVTQEVLFRICQKAERYDRTYPLAPWIYRVAGNLCTDHFRSKNFRLCSKQVAFDDAPQSECVSKTTPEDETLRGEILTRIRRSIEALPPRQRRILRMRLFHEYRLNEIAEAQGIPLGTVKSTLHHALRRLRNALSDLQT
ncbi:MAG: RNA polymerase sigma factor [Acidobacteriota bacterium]